MEPMTDNVVEFPSKQDVIWQCNCGCQTHFDHGDWIECASCGKARPEGSWEFVKSTEPVAGDPVIVRTYGNEEFLIRNFQDEIAKPEVVGILLVYDSGRTRSIVHDDKQGTEEQKHWWRRRCVDFLNQIKVSG